MAIPVVLTPRFFFAGIVQFQAVLPYKAVIHPSTGNVRAIKAILMFREYPPIGNKKGSKNSTVQSALTMVPMVRPLRGAWWHCSLVVLTGDVGQPGDRRVVLAG